MEHASAAFLDAVRLSMRAIRSTLGAATVDPALLTAAERLQHQGFQESLRVVTQWDTRRRRAELMRAQGLQKAPSARTVARLMGTGRDHLSKANTVTVAAVEAGVPGLAGARTLMERFQAMIRTKTAGELDGWIEQARASLVAPLAWGVAKDVAAIRAAITEPWSNGQAEGQITRLKLIKRQMYGRAKEADSPVPAQPGSEWPAQAPTRALGHRLAAAGAPGWPCLLYCARADVRRDRQRSPGSVSAVFVRCCTAVGRLRMRASRLVRPGSPDRHAPHARHRHAPTLR